MVHPRDLTFDPPGPGLWQIDGLHTPKPISALKGATYVQIPHGMKVGFSRYGLLNQGIELAILHRFVYASFGMLVYRPPGDDVTARQRFDALAAANPELQERFQRADYALTNKRWREDRIHWDTIGRPWMMGRTLSLTDENPAEMTDAALDLHIQECTHHLASASQYHHILNMVPTLPRSLLFYKTCQWTGMDPHQLEPLMVGSSPISAGDEPELRDLVDALEADASALSDIGSDKIAAADLLESLAVRQDRVGEAYRSFVRMVGYRTVDGWEPMNPYILETPALIVEKIRHGLTRNYATMDRAYLENVRSAVPGQHQAEFDELLEDARTNSRIRDERDLYCNIPICGLLRRGVMEAGRRAAGKGQIEDPEHMAECTLPEINQILCRGRSDLADELASRYEYRARFSIDDIPPVIGTRDPMQMPVDPDWLPPGASLLTRVLMGAQALNTGPADDEANASSAIIKGRPVSPGTYTGIARVVLEAGEINDIQQNEVLITRSTSPAFNIVLPRLGALVTEYGGVLSHAAIVSREFGLPGIVGCKKVTQRVKTGDRVTVNGDNGELTIHT